MVYEQFYAYYDDTDNEHCKSPFDRAGLPAAADIDLCGDGLS